MPLSPPAARTPIHTRRITLEGYQREDGMFDIEGRMEDCKSYGFDLFDRGHLDAGDKVHGMAMRWTVDEHMLIHAAEAVMEHTPFNICAEVAPNFAALAGLTIGRGFLREANGRVAGTAGCTHLREMFQQMATVAFQTIAGLRITKGGRGRGKALANTCYGHAEDNEVARRHFPDRLTPSPAEG